MNNNNWLPFGSEPLNGVYWVTGTYPVMDGDLAADGSMYGTYTGEDKAYVALVSIEFEPGESCEVEAVNCHETGDFDDDYHITHYQPFVMPQPPVEVNHETVC